jgi:MFS family permease
LLIPAVSLAPVAAIVFISWKSLPALLAARILTSLALGGSAAAATAYITDLDSGPDGMPTRRAGIVATTANVGGLALGPLVSGLLARYVPDGLGWVGHPGASRASPGYG